MTLSHDSFPGTLLDQCATGHLRYLQGSLLNLLGANFVKRVYRFAAESRESFVCIRHVDDMLCGVALVVMSSETFARSMLVYPPLSIAMLERALNPRIFLRLASQLLKSGSGNLPRSVPELLFIFTTAQARGQGVGKTLLCDVEMELSRRGHSEYYVKTTRSDANAAIEFYRKAGFSDDARMPQGDRSFVYLVKRMPEQRGQM